MSALELRVYSRKDSHDPRPGEAAPPPTVAGLFDAYAPLVGRWAFRLGGPNVEAEDVVQDVFVVVSQRLGAYRPEARITTWLYKITENVVHQHRWRGRWRRLLGGARGEGARVQSRDLLPLERVEQREARERVYRILDQMSEKRRTVLVLFEWEQLSGEEIAERMGAKVATVFVWLHRARAEFGKRLRELEAGERGDGGAP